MTDKKVSKFNTLPLKEAALLYEKIGWPVLALKAKTKDPTGWSWGGKEATKISAQEIERRWSNTPYARRMGGSSENNIGIIGGVPGSNLIHLDIDHKRVIDDIAIGILIVEDTVTSKTSGIKKHLIFTTDKEYPSIDVADNNEKEYASLRAKGKYIAVPSSVHPITDKTYQYEKGKGPDQIRPAQFTDHIYDYLLALKIELKMEGWRPSYEKKYQTNDKLQEFLQKELEPKTDIRLVMHNLANKGEESFVQCSESPEYVHYALGNAKGDRSIVWNKNKKYIYDNNVHKGFSPVGFVGYWLKWDFKNALNWLCDLFDVKHFKFGGKYEPSKDEIKKAKTILLDTLKEVEKDNTAIFKKEAMEAATLLYTHEFQPYYQYINHLKKLEIPNIKELEQRVKEKQKEAKKKSDSVFESSYTVLGGCISWIKGDQIIPLCNADLRIFEDTILDDGIDKVRLYKIRGKTKDDKILEPTVVQASQYQGLSWLANAFGTKVELKAGSQYKEHLAAAIINKSKGEIAFEQVFGHSGWRNIDCADTFLHRGGGIGIASNNATLKVDLSLGARGLPNATILNELNLPEPPCGAELESAVRMTLALSDLAPYSISLPCLCAIFTAPLASMLRVDFAIWMVGKTGIFKTELASLCQAHFGRGFESRTIPGNWLSTANYLERVAFLLKDCLFLIDNFRPVGSMTYVQQVHRTASRLIRAQGDLIGRGRLNPDSSVKGSYPPRGLIFVTGEDTLRADTDRARLFIVDVKEGDIEPKNLTPLQKAGKAGSFDQTMSGYLQYLAECMPKLKKEITSDMEELRNEIRSKHRLIHNRLPTTAAMLLIGLKLFLEFARNRAGLTRKEYDVYWEAAKEAIINGALAQADHIIEEDPVNQFWYFLRAGLDGGHCHICSTADGERVNNDDLAQALGWRVDRRVTDQGASENWRAQGKRIGWIDPETEDDIYLIAKIAFNIAQEQASKEGHAIPLTPFRLWQNMKERKLIANHDKRKTGKYQKIMGEKHWVTHIKKQTLLPDEDGNPEELREPGEE